MRVAYEYTPPHVLRRSPSNTRDRYMYILVSRLTRIAPIFRAEPCAEFIPVIGFPSRIGRIAGPRVVASQASREFTMNEGCMS